MYPNMDLGDLDKEKEKQARYVVCSECPPSRTPTYLSPTAGRITARSNADDASRWPPTSTSCAQWCPRATHCNASPTSSPYCAWHRRTCAISEVCSMAARLLCLYLLQSPIRWISKKRQPAPVAERQPVQALVSHRPGAKTPHSGGKLACADVATTVAPT